MRIARAMWAAVLAICLEIPDVVAQECGSSSDQKVGLVAAGAATDGQGGFTTLHGPQAVSTFAIDGSTYAIVAARSDDGIQIVDVSDPSNPVPVSSATDGQGGFTTLAGARAVSTFVRGSRTYAIVGIHLGYPDNGIQIVDVSDPSNPVPVSSATDGEGGFTELDGAFAVSTFAIDGSTYAIVAATYDNGIQIVSIPDCGARVPAFNCLSHVLSHNIVNTPGLEFCLIHWTTSHLPSARSCLWCRSCRPHSSGKLRVLPRVPGVHPDRDRQLLHYGGRVPSWWDPYQVHRRVRGSVVADAGTLCWYALSHCID